jgi:hypothetical protein
MILTISDWTSLSELVGKEVKRLETESKESEARQGLICYYKSLLGKVLTEEEYYRNLHHKSW